ncbi:MAG TPA: hypothetical protein VLA89_06745 [Gemmatimonadales bacterium]|nr:hypothetical protein [Gemmatimonadales bacterium]
MEQEQISTAAAASVATEGQEGAPAPSVVPTDNAAPGTEAAPAINWDSEENPHFVRARELETAAQRAERLAQENELFRQQFAQAARLAEQQRRAQIRQDFDDGRIDSAEYHRRIDRVLEERDQYWQQQMTPYLTRDWADQVAQNYGLTSDERQQLYGLDGHAMEFAARQIVDRRNLVPASKVAELESKFEQLQRSMAANQIANSGVNQTLQSNPSGTGSEPAPGTMAQLKAFLRSEHPSLYQRRG